MGKNQEPEQLGKNQEPELLEKKSGTGAGAAKKFAGSPALIFPLFSSLSIIISHQHVIWVGGGP